MPKFEKNGLTIETNLPREAARLRSEGFREVKAEKPKPSAPVKTDNK